MGSNRTLGEFGGGEDDGPKPIEPVRRWSPDPTPCPRCGEARQALWVDGDRSPRCDDCKEW